MGGWAVGFVSELEGVELVEAGLLFYFIGFGNGGDMLYHLTFGNLYYYRHFVRSSSQE